MKYYLYFLSTFLIFSIGLNAQHSNTIKLKIGDIDLKNNVDIVTAKDLENSYYAGAYYLLLQFNEIPNLAEQKRLKQEGVHLISYIPHHSYIAKVERKTLLKKSSWKRNIRHLSNFHPAFKISPAILNAEGKMYVNVLFHESLSKEVAQQLLEGKYRKWDSFNGSGRLLKLEVEKEMIPAIANLPIVNYISITTKDFDPLIEESKETARVGQVKHNLGLGLSGNGVTVSVGDGGTIDNHIDLNDRIQNENLIDINSHGSQTAGIVAGEGILDPTTEGYAPEATIYADYFSRVIQFDDAYYSNFGTVISNNSYANGIVTTLCAEAGEYTAESVDVDGSLRTLDEVIHVFSSGNDGGQTCAPYATGYGTVRNAWNSAKNTLVVGNTTYLNAISGSSSRGPVKDGRLKPEIVAVGTSVTTTSFANNYTTGTGTSFSSPAVAGALALLYEHYKDLNAGANPKGDLMKAIVTNTAYDLGNAGPDYIYGFGTLDVYRAAKTVTDGNYTTGTIANTGNNTHNIVVPAGANQLKVMLYWHDAEGTASANPALVNNLDLTLTDPAASTVMPLVLDPSAANCANPAVPGVDNLNNIEQVVIDNPAAGTYTVNVDGTSVPMGSQNYVIVYDIIEDHLALSSPMGGEFYSGGESINITWNASGFDANTFTLEYSLDNGGTWTTISNTVPGTDRNYEWNVPTTFTNEGLVRVTWNGTGLGSDQSLSNFTIMDVPTNLVLIPNCDASIRINWNASNGATSYDVFEYTGGAWVTIATGITPTEYTVTGLTAGQNYHYTVRPIAGTVVGPRMRGRSAVALGTPSGTISTFPYIEDFESDGGNWVTHGKNSSWEWGAPSSTIINRAAEGSNCWTTNATGNYNDSEKAYLVSPCFDLSSLTNPELSFAFILDIEDANDGNGNPFYDIARVEYSINGRTWFVLGTNGTGHNWYNNYMGNNAWDDTKGYWHSASYIVPVTANRVNFRFLLDADGFSNQEGIAIDNIVVREANEIYNGGNTSVSQSVSGTDWVHFESGGQRVISINPNGNNLGNTSADVYINTGTLRDNTMQYYLDRNWKITPTTAPSSDVSVRLYLLDTEVEAMRAAAGSCASCSTISDAFIAGVTKYSGANENGDLSDNAGTYSYFIPADAEFVPYANGYYVAFDTPGFSEFYINGGGSGMDVPLPVDLIGFQLKKDRGDAVLDWTTASETNSSRFEIEVARGTSALIQGDFVRIGTVAAQGESSSLVAYQFKDIQSNKVGQRYYRIKMVDKDETFEYTVVKMLDFGNDISVNIYPNPSKGEFVLQINSANLTKGMLRISDQLGRVVYSEDITVEVGANEWNDLHRNANLSAGFYHLELSVGESKWVEKLVIEL